MVKKIQPHAVRDDETFDLYQINLSGRLRMAEIAEPGTPPSGYGYLYVKSDGKIYLKDDAGTEYDLTQSGGGGQSWVSVYDDGVFAGSGTAFDFNDNLDVTISGGVIIVDGQAGGGGGGGLGIVAWDSGEYIGTGTIINFDENLDVSISGTVIEVDATGGGGGVNVYEDGILITGSATDISFDVDMEVSATGAVVFVQQRARYCIVRNTSTQSIANGGGAVVHSEVAGGETWWWSASGTSRVYVPEVGLYLVNGGFCYTSGIQDIWIQLTCTQASGSAVGSYNTFTRLDATGTNYRPGITKSTTFYVSAVPAFFTMNAGHDSGAARTLQENCHMNVAYLGYA